MAKTSTKHAILKVKNVICSQLGAFDASEWHQKCKDWFGKSFESFQHILKKFEFL